MSKVILFLAFICLAVLTVGSIVAQNSPGMWLASTTLGYNLLRLGLMVLLFALMLTDPPRHHIFRVIVTFAAVSLTIWSLSSTYNNNMKLLDSASILAASISMGIVVLEFNNNKDTELILKERHHPKKIRQIPVHPVHHH